jgi:hypothetical protein
LLPILIAQPMFSGALNCNITCAQRVVESSSSVVKLVEKFTELHLCPDVKEYAYCRS